MRIEGWRWSAEVVNESGVTFPQRISIYTALAHAPAHVQGMWKRPHTLALLVRKQLAPEESLPHFRPFIPLTVFPRFSRLCHCAPYRSCPRMRFDLKRLRCRTTTCMQQSRRVNWTLSRQTIQLDEITSRLFSFGSREWPVESSAVAINSDGYIHLQRIQFFYIFFFFFIVQREFFWRPWKNSIFYYLEKET